MKKQLTTLLLTLYFSAAMATGIFNVRDYGAKGDGKMKKAVPCEHILITNCLVTGYKLGTFLDGTYQPEAVNWVCGRIKLGTESNGGYRNISLTNCTTISVNMKRGHYLILIIQYHTDGIKDCTLDCGNKPIYKRKAKGKITIIIFSKSDAENKSTDP